MARDTEKTRRRILDASLKLLESSNGEDVLISDVAAEAGITRQTLYYYFASRAALLIATTHHLDEVKGSSDRLSPSRKAETGVQRLEEFITAWANYIPEIYRIAQALTAMNNLDANTAWDKRMQDMWEGCEAAIKALDNDGLLAEHFSVKEASDLLWTLLSVKNWELLRGKRRWSQRKYEKSMKATALLLFVKPEE